MRTSKGEQKVASLLKRNGIPFKTEIMFKGLVGKKHIQLRYDFAIIKNNKVFILIEVDGGNTMNILNIFIKIIVAFLGHKKEIE